VDDIWRLRERGRSFKKRKGRSECPNLSRCGYWNLVSKKSALMACAAEAANMNDKEGRKKRSTVDHWVVCSRPPNGLTLPIVGNKGGRSLVGP